MILAKWFPDKEEHFYYNGDEISQYSYFPYNKPSWSLILVPPGLGDTQLDTMNRFGFLERVIDDRRIFESSHLYK